MLNKIIKLLLALTFALASLPAFAINPGAGQMQIQNNLQQMEINKNRMKQQQIQQQQYQQLKKKTPKQQNFGTQIY